MTVKFEKSLTAMADIFFGFTVDQLGLSSE